MFNSIKTYPYTKENIELLFDKNNCGIKKYIKYFEFTDKEKKLIKFGTTVALLLILKNYNAYASTTTFAYSPEGSLMGLWQNLQKYTRLTAYIVFVYKSIETIIKGAIDENLESCWKKVIGYILGFLGVKFIPQIFDAINKM